MKKTLVRQGAVKALLLAAIFVFTPNLGRAEDPSPGPRKLLVKTPAVIPSLARSMNIRGVVKLEAVVEPNGTVKSIDVKGGHPLLTQSAVTAVGHWKFEPAPHQTRET